MWRSRRSTRPLPPLDDTGRGPGRGRETLVVILSAVAAVPAAAIGALGVYVLVAFFTGSTDAPVVVYAVGCPIAAILVGSGAFVWARRSFTNRFGER
jgi:hypothetical protein